MLNKFKIVMWQLAQRMVDRVDIRIREYGETPGIDAYKIFRNGNDSFKIYGMEITPSMTNDDVYFATEYEDLGSGTLSEIISSFAENYGAENYKIIDVNSTQTIQVG